MRDIEIEAPIEVSNPGPRRHAPDEIGSIMRPRLRVALSTCPPPAGQTSPASFHLFRQPEASTGTSFLGNPLFVDSRKAPGGCLSIETR